MALFNKFNKKKLTHIKTGFQDEAFGRYLAFNKSLKTKRVFDDAISRYNNKDYLGCFEKLLSYLSNSKGINVTLEEHQNRIEYSLLQGTQIITGTIDNDEFNAYTKLGSYKELNSGLFRHLLIKNHILQYCHFAIEQNKIILKANSKTSESSPEKLFFILKELAITSEHEATFIKKEFPLLEKSAGHYSKKLPEKELKSKVKFLKKWLSGNLDLINNLNPERNIILISYYVFATIYRIDFLLLPYDFVREKLEQCIFVFNKKDIPVKQRLDQVKEIFKEISGTPDDELSRSFQSHVHTFSIIEASNHKQVYDFILTHIENASKNINKGFNGYNIATIYEYIIGYCLYYFGIYPATKKLFILAYRVLHPDFFADMGYSPDLLLSKDKSFNKSEIEKELAMIINEGRKEFPRLGLITSNISYDSLQNFLKSLLIEVTYLNFSQTAK